MPVDISVEIFVPINLWSRSWGEVFALCSRFAVALILITSRFADEVDSGTEPALEIVCAESRLNVLDDVECLCVRQSGFQAEADLNVHHPIIYEDEQHNTVLAILLTDPPAIRDAQCVIANRRIGLHFAEYGYHDLI